MVTYQWLRCDTAGLNCVPIVGATGSTYTLTAADQGHTVTVQASDGTSTLTATFTSTVTAATSPGTATSGGGSIFREIQSVPPGAGGGGTGGAPASGGGGGGTVGQPSHSMKGWNALMYAVASDLPTAQRNAVRIRAAALRLLR